MRVNSNRPELWKKDIQQSVDFYNSWFLKFAPRTFRESRKEAIIKVRDIFPLTNLMREFTVTILVKHPATLSILRMCTAPPLARDRLSGLAGVRRHLITIMEKDNTLPSRNKDRTLSELKSLLAVIRDMLDKDLFVWISENRDGTANEITCAETVIADRLTGATSDPIIRNAQERRQLTAVANYLKSLGYDELPDSRRSDWQSIPPGTYAFRMNIPVTNQNGRTVNIPVDIVIRPMTGEQPVLIEAKSAGDFTNPNKRRKEEAQKINQLRNTYGDLTYFLLLCGYFDSGYLGYEAAEGIDWVWEHRLKDLKGFGL